MTAIARLTRAELRKLTTTPAFLITLAITVALAVISVVANAANAGRNGAAPLGTDAATYQMLKLGPVIFVAMLVLGIIASGGEYRHRTIIPAMLIAPRRGGQIAAKALAVAIAGVVLSGLTFGLGLAAAAGELHARGLDRLPAGTAGMFAGSVAAAVLFGLIGAALGYITRSTVAAVVGAVGWVIFAEYAIVHTVAPKLFNWLISGTATVLASPPMPGNTAPTPLAAAAVLAAYTAVLLTAATWFVRRRDVA
jgi:ABC-type transport system involved in multi-copper enzyme maturation permease subunit